MTKLVLPYPWEQGEHCCVIGDTGSGKTTLMYGLDGEPGLLSWRKYAIALRSKGDDAKWLTAKRVKVALPAMKDPELFHIELFPRRGHEAREFKIALETAYRQKNTAVYLDETYHADKLLKLRPIIDDLLTRGRSLGITVVTGLQRPVGVSRFAISQSKHVISFAQEGRDAKTIAEATTPRMVEVLEQLPRHYFAWFERATRQIWTGTLQDLWG
ncbi:MAG: hypothetical protein HY323_08140 [Betaproteobacteria bacterium]|nr:hypothetical protein [Betaproteobacteria bacterium]